MRKKVLAVDDHRGSLKLIKTILELDGFHVNCASHVREALTSIYADSPDIILMDLKMPDISGWECIQTLKSRPETKHIPIIALTASGSLDFEKCQRTPYDALITKPYLPAELKQQIEQLTKYAFV